MPIHLIVIDGMVIDGMVIEGVTAETGMIVRETTATATTTVGEAAIVIAMVIVIVIAIAIEIEMIEMIIDATLTGRVPIGGSDGIIVDRIAATIGGVSAFSEVEGRRFTL